MWCRGAGFRFCRRAGRIAACVMVVAGLSPVAAMTGPADASRAGISPGLMPAAHSPTNPFAIAPGGGAFQPRAPEAPALGRQTADVGSEEEGLTAPSVVDPKRVETRPFGPGGEKFAGREEVLSPQPVLIASGTAKWDDAYDTLVAAIKTLQVELTRLGLKPAGDVFVVYRESNDNDFKYEVQIPFSGVTTKKPSGGLTLGASYAGKVMRFSHSGAFTDMDNTYEMIANYLDEKNITAGDLYMEQYRTDLVTSPPDALTIDILVPVP